MSIIEEIINETGMPRWLVIGTMAGVMVLYALMFAVMWLLVMWLFLTVKGMMA